jgi:hypothetical protein
MRTDWKNIKISSEAKQLFDATKGKLASKGEFLDNSQLIIKAMKLLTKNS